MSDETIGGHETTKWTDLFGLDPDFTGESCSVDWVRWSRGADDPDEFVHEACLKLLNATTEETP